MARGFWVAAWLGSVLATAPAHASPGPGSFWVSLSGEYRTSTFFREWAGFVSVSIPFDRLAAPRVVVAEGNLSEDPAKRDNAGSPIAPGPVPPPAPKKRDPLMLLLTPKLARGAVRHALAAAGYLDTRVRLGSLSGRARSSAVLPEMRLRALHSTGGVLRLTPTTQDPYSYTQAGTSELLFEARFTWHLDRLVFSDQEVSIERLQNERDSAEHKLVERVLERLALWQRSRVRAADEDSEPEVRETAELEALGAAVELDVLTDGWFSQVIGQSDELGAKAPSVAPSEKPKVEVDTARHAR